MCDLSCSDEIARLMEYDEIMGIYNLIGEVEKYAEYRIILRKGKRRYELHFKSKEILDEKEIRSMIASKFNLNMELIVERFSNEIWHVYCIE